MTESQLLDSISTKELAYWKAYSILEPFGPLEEAKRFNELKAFIANMFKKQGSEPITAERFAVDFEKLEEVLFETEEEKMQKAREALKAFAATFNKSKNKKKEIKRVPRRKK